ncbi:pentapeptide repeat-containing protein [Virgibacillus sp. FSP13]
MEQIHEMIAYAAEALSYDIPTALSDKLVEKLKGLQNLTKLDADELFSLDLVMYRFSLNELLTVASASIRENTIAKLPGAKKVKDFDHAVVDWMCKKLKDKDLRATDFRGVYLIAADLRDADFSGANLSASMFLT